MGEERHTQLHPVEASVAADRADEIQRRGDSVDAGADHGFVPSFKDYNVRFGLDVRGEPEGDAEVCGREVATTGPGVPAFLHHQPVVFGAAFSFTDEAAFRGREVAFDDGVNL